MWMMNLTVVVAGGVVVVKEVVVVVVVVVEEGQRLTLSCSTSCNDDSWEVKFAAKKIREFGYTPGDTLNKGIVVF